MLFNHSPQLLDQFPQLSVATLSVTGVTAAPDVADSTRVASSSTQSAWPAARASASAASSRRA